MVNEQKLFEMFVDEGDEILARHLLTEEGRDYFSAFQEEVRRDLTYEAMVARFVIGSAESDEERVFTLKVYEKVFNDWIKEQLRASAKKDKKDKEA